MKRVSFCVDCGSQFDADMGFCPKCDFQAGGGESGIPALADMWDMSMDQLGVLAQAHNIRGWRRLDQRSLIYQLNQLRVVQVEEDTRRTEEEAKQRNIERLTEEFLGFAKVRDVNSARTRFEALSEIGDEIDQQITLTMDWLLLPSQIAEALSVEDIPPLAFQINDPQITKAAQDMVKMIGYREEVKLKLSSIKHSSEVPPDLLDHSDPVVSKSAKSCLDKLAGMERAKAEEESLRLERAKARKEGIATLAGISSLEEFPTDLLTHEDDELRMLAEDRLSELEQQKEHLELIDLADSLDQIGTELMEHDSDIVSLAAKRKYRTLLGEHKRDLLHKIENSRIVDEIPSEAFKDSDASIVSAANERKKFLESVVETVASIDAIYTSEPLEELLEHDDARVRDAARLRLRLLDEIPSKLRTKTSSSRYIRAVDTMAAEWAAEAAESEKQRAEAIGKASTVGFSLGDEVDVNYIGQRFSGVVQGFTSDGEFVEIMNDETSTVWPIPFDCVQPR